MDANALRALQAPLKERYKQDPDAAVVTLKAQGANGGPSGTLAAHLVAGDVYSLIVLDGKNGGLTAQ